MRSSDTATRIVLRSENGWMAEQIDLRAIERLFLGDVHRRAGPAPELKVIPDEGR
jgi:hypothetical protein